MIRNSLTIKPYDQIAEWDEFVKAHPKGSILHTTSMIRCEESTKRHEPYAFGAIDANGDLCALLVSVRVSTLDGIASALSSRAIMYAEPIYVDTEAGNHGVRRLIEQHDLDMSRNTLFAEVRPLFDCPKSHDPFLESSYQRLGYINYELPINHPEEVLFRRMNEKRRNNVRSAIRKGVRVEEVDLKNGIDDFYRLVAESYCRSQVPIVDTTLFTAVANEFCSSQVRLLIARYQGVPVATGCFLAYKDRVICWYAGMHRIPGVYSMVLVFWEAIRQYSQEGYTIFDFAGAGWQGEEFGPGKFKAKFGGEQTNHGRYRKVYSTWKLKTAESIYSMVRGWVAPNSESLVIRPTANKPVSQ